MNVLGTSKVVCDRDGSQGAQPQLAELMFGDRRCVRDRGLPRSAHGNTSGIVAGLSNRGVFALAGSRAQRCLNRCGVIPSFFILDSSVCLGIPRIAAAPFAPAIRPAASRTAFSIITFSRSAISFARVALRADDLGLTVRSQFGSTENVSPSQRITARSITFCNSRTLPGHE